MCIILIFSYYVRKFSMHLIVHLRQKHEFPCKKSHLACHHATLSAEAGRNHTWIFSVLSHFSSVVVLPSVHVYQLLYIFRWRWIRALYKGSLCVKLSKVLIFISTLIFCSHILFTIICLFYCYLLDMNFQ